MNDTSPHGAVLDFWFGKLTADGICQPEVSQRWFKKDAEFDRETFERFGWLHAVLSASPQRDHRPAWITGGESLLAAILVLDQFSRNMYRGTPAMFAADGTAQSWALEVVGLGWDRTMKAPHATFCYMPLMHSERLEDQERCVELFETLEQRLSGVAQSSVRSNISYAVQHRDIVRRFGRFPHRNAILGRANTKAEEEFLKEPGSSF